MSRTRKIAPYIPYSVPLNSFNSHKEFLRKRPSKIIQIDLAKTLCFFTFPSFPKHSYFTKLIKLLKGVKGPKQILFNQYVVNKYGLSSPSIISLVKRARRIQKLSIHDIWVPQIKFKPQLDFWMKYPCHLQTLIFRLGGFVCLVRDERHVANAIKVALKSLRFQCCMKSLTIETPPPKTSFTTPILLEGSKYPRSLEKLQFLCKGGEYQASETKLPCFSLCYFKKLETFAFKITNDHAVMSHIMDSLSSLQNLKSLAFDLPGAFLVPELPVFSNLTHLSIKIPQEWNQSSLLESLNLSNLQSLQLSLALVFPEEYQKAASNLSRMKHLKGLNLSVTYFKQLENLIQIFFENIAKLELLTSLRVHLVSTDPLASEKSLPSDVLPMLEGIFRKTIKIQDFSLEGKELAIHEDFPRLMEIFGASASKLRKFRLDTASFVLGQNDIKSLLIFMENLKDLRALKLPCLEISSYLFLTRLTSGIMKLKKIRSVSLGKIGEDIQEQEFLDSFRKIIEKRGLESFKCEIAENLRKRFSVRLSFEKIMEKNPFLKNISFDLLKIIHMVKCV